MQLNAKYLVVKCSNVQSKMHQSHCLNEMEDAILDKEGTESSDEEQGRLDDSVAEMSDRGSLVMETSVGDRQMLAISHA